MSVAVAAISLAAEETLARIIISSCCDGLLARIVSICCDVIEVISREPWRRKG